MSNPVQLNKVSVKITKGTQPQTGDVAIKSTDTNPPQNPQVLRAFCFDHITDPSTHVVPQPPPPRPNPPPRRDPFLLELGNIELGSKVQFISLTDNPNADFKAGEVFELSFTGYDANSRRGTVLLSAEEMEKKAIQPGERLIVRVVDDNGNASDGVHVHVDPQRWANNGQLNTKNAEGQDIQVQGAPISFVDGFVAPGADVAQATKNTFGATLSDTVAPQLLAEGVAVKTFEWTKGEAEMYGAIAGTNHFQNNTVGEAVTWCADSANLDTVPIQFRAIVAEMTHDDGALLKKMLGSLYPDKSAAEIGEIRLTQQMFQQISQSAMNAVTNSGGRETMVVFNQALEPGARIQLQNNSTGQSINGAQNDQQRTSVVRMHLNQGDKVTVSFNDGNGVRGDPYSFEYDGSNKTGKRSESEKGGKYKSPLELQASMMAKRTVKLNGE